jgi:peptidoglycan/xylan/chitin deacetylase (PgdA/CDA1 family)
MRRLRGSPDLVGVLRVNQMRESPLAHIALGSGTATARVQRFISSGLRRAAAAAVCARLRCSSARVGLALCYHAVAPEEGDPVRELSAPVARRTFRRQLRHLRRWYRVVPASALPGAVARRARWQRLPVAITFDDDLRSHLDHAVPALEELELPATFFLTGVAMEQPVSFWWQLLQRAWERRLLDDDTLDAWGLSAGEGEPTIRDAASALQSMRPAERDDATETLRQLLPDEPEPATLSREQIAVLARRGFEVGFHTRRHDDLLNLPDEALADAMVLGRAELERVACAPMRVISYPHGRADARVARCAAAAGFAAGYVGDGTAVSPETDTRLLGRRYPSRGSMGAFSLDLARTLAAAARR